MIAATLVALRENLKALTLSTMARGLESRLRDRKSTRLNSSH